MWLLHRVHTSSCRSSKGKENRLGSKQPGIRYWKGIMTCQVTKYYPNPTYDGNGYATPVIHLYWKAEGTQEWKLLRLDADYLFNRDYTGPDIWDETLNYISVGLEDWRK